MKLVFVASVAGKEELDKSYKLISTICNQNGHIIYDDYVFKFTPENISNSSIANLKENYKKVSAKIKDCDVVIAETTQSSLGVGRFISIALQHHKPVLVLYSKYLPRTLVFDPTRLMVLKKYSANNEKDLEKKIKSFLEQSSKKKLSYRFNLMITKEMNSYILKKAKEEGISKADYIRKMISTSMEEDL